MGGDWRFYILMVNGQFTQRNNSQLCQTTKYMHCFVTGMVRISGWERYGGGLKSYSTTLKIRFITFTEKDGLQNTTIYQYTGRSAGTHLAFVPTPALAALICSTKSFRNFTNYTWCSDLTTLCMASGIRLYNGELVFGGLQGFNYFYPADAYNKSQCAERALLTDLKISNKSAVAGDDSP